MQLRVRHPEAAPLPDALARESLPAEDWTAIRAAFASNNDPIVGIPAQKAFRELFRRLVASMPPPYGVGPEARRD